MYSKTDTEAKKKERKNKTAEALLCCTARQAPMLYKRKRVVHLKPCFTVQKDRHPCCTEKERLVHLRPCCTEGQTTELQPAVIYSKTDTEAIQKERIIHLRPCWAVQCTETQAPKLTKEERVDHLKPCFNVHQDRHQSCSERRKNTPETLLSCTARYRHPAELFSKTGTLAVQKKKEWYI
jgi:hypothetical protein